MFVHEAQSSDRQASQRETDKMIQKKLGSSNFFTIIRNFSTDIFCGLSVNLMLISFDILSKFLDLNSQTNHINETGQSLSAKANIISI